MSRTVPSSEKVASLLVQTAELLREDFAKAVAPFGLSVPVARALLLLAEPLPMRGLAEELSCDQSYVTRIADELERYGLAVRTRGRDRRVQVVTLTTSGDDIRTRLAVSVAEHNRVARLSAPQREALARVLDRVLRTSI